LAGEEVAVGETVHGVFASALQRLSFRGNHADLNFVGDIPFHHFLNVYSGYEKGYLDLFDYPGKVERLLETMHQCLREKMWPVAANSPGTLFLHGAHFSSQTTPANYFEQYMLPYMQEFADYMHSHSKKVVHHADNDTSEIIDLLKRSRYDMHECFVTAPMVPITLAEAREAPWR